MTIGRETFPAPNPFLVMATQNPIESEGTYALPEAQVDRFMLKVLVGYPTPTEEFVVVERMTTRRRADHSRCIDTETLLDYQQAADAVYVDPAIIQYAVRLGTATRDPAPVGLPRPGPLPVLRRQPARVDQHGPGGQGAGVPAGPRLRLAARRRATSPATCCATASCCPTRRWPTASRADDLLGAASSPPSPLPGRTPQRDSAGRRLATDAGMRPASRPDARAPAAPAGVAGHPPARRPAAGRLPDAVPRDRRRLRRPARVRAGRRPAAHRLERHRADGHALRARVPRGPRGDGVAAARPLGVDGLRPGRPAEARRCSPRSPRRRPAPGPRRQPGRRRCSSTAASSDDPARRTGATRCCGSCHGCCRRRPARGVRRAGRGPPTSRACCAPALGVARRRSLRRHRLRLHHRAGLGAAAGPARRAATTSSPSRCVDPREFELPAAGMIYVEDAETGEQIFVDTDDPGFQQRLRAAADERQAALVAAAATAGHRALHRRHRRGPRPRPGPDLRAAQAEATMTFEWPRLLLSPRSRSRCWWWGTGGCSGRARPRRAAARRRSAWSPQAPASGRRTARRAGPAAHRAHACCSSRWPGRGDHRRAAP